MVTTPQQQNNNIEYDTYATPFDVDLSTPKSEKFFEAYTIKVTSLPELIKNILMDSSTAEFIEENLGPNFNLTPEQKIEITRIIRDVLLGDLFIGEMLQNISDRMKLLPDEARKLGNLIVSELFGPAIEDIKKMQIEKFPEKINRPIPEKPDLKIEPDINKNNIVDLRNK